MNKTAIEWTDYSWNPIKGLCPVNCKTPDGKEYCYARRMYKRFKWNPEMRIEEIRFCPKKPSRIFVCSTIELFHPLILKEWRDIIFRFIENCPQHTFQILTKFPQNIDREMPDNVHLGVTVENNRDNITERILFLLDSCKARIKFVSFEPMLEKIDPPYIGDLDWIIIGKLTQHGHKYDPKKTWIRNLVRTAKKYNTKVFLKDNLKEIWGDDLIQEFPRE